MKQWTTLDFHYFKSHLGVKLWILLKISSVAIHNSSSDQQCRSQQTLHPSALAYQAGLPAEQRRVQGHHPEIWSVLQDCPHLPERTPSSSLITTSYGSCISPNSESASQTGQMLPRGGDDFWRSWIQTMDLLPWGERNKLTCKLQCKPHLSSWTVLNNIFKQSEIL